MSRSVLAPPPKTLVQVEPHTTPHTTHHSPLTTHHPPLTTHHSTLLVSMISCCRYRSFHRYLKRDFRRRPHRMGIVARHSQSVSPHLCPRVTVPLNSPSQLRIAQGARVKVCLRKVGRASGSSTMRALKARPRLLVLRCSEMRLP